MLGPDFEDFKRRVKDHTTGSGASSQMTATRVSVAHRGEYNSEGKSSKAAGAPQEPRSRLLSGTSVR
jgi:hypothetical protein